MSMVTGAKNVVEQVKNTPPWIAALSALAVALGGGGGGTFAYKAIQDNLKEIQKSQFDFTRSLDNMEWRIIQNSNRLENNHSTNREQDRALNALDKMVTRIETLRELERKP